MKKIDYRSFNTEIYTRKFTWLYYNYAEQEFKCKIYELFPSTGQGFAQAKFSQMALKMLGDHPRQTLTTHDESNNNTLF